MVYGSLDNIPFSNAPLYTQKWWFRSDNDTMWNNGNCVNDRKKTCHKIHFGLMTIVFYSIWQIRTHTVLLVVCLIKMVVDSIQKNRKSKSNKEWNACSVECRHILLYYMIRANRSHVECNARSLTISESNYKSECHWNHTRL